jgi:hypothetical protein
MWSSFKVGHLTKLNGEQKLEFSKLKEYSEHLMSKNFTDIKTGLDRIFRSINGYNIYRINSNNKFIISLNLTTNQIELKKSI